MNWIQSLQSHHPVAGAILSLSLVAVAGLGLGNVKVKGVGLGAAGVLFAGIVFGHFGFQMDPGTLGFVRDFGLILFVYTIGMQVGPGFAASLRKEGFRMNALAALLVVSGGLLTLLLARIFGQDDAAMMGVFAGASTNTPALGAAQEALKSLPGRAESVTLAGMGCAVSYPGGILGLIGFMIACRAVWRVDPAAEAAELQREQEASRPQLRRMSLVVENANLAGVLLGDLPGLREFDINVSRIKPAGSEVVQSARPDWKIQVGDVLLAVGVAEQLARLRLVVGREVADDLTQLPGEVTTRRLVVTHREMLGETLGRLDLPGRLGVVVTRISRGEVEFSANPRVRLQFGDIVQIVGRDEDIRRAEVALGNSARALHHTNFLAIFVGIALGVLAGLYPVEVPGLPVPLRLGLAGGPLVVALLISRLGHLGPVVWHMPFNANLALRELGLTMFLAAVGLASGAGFVATFQSGEGFVWMGLGALVTVLPLILVAWLGRRWARLPFATLCGIMSGALTDPPALAFASSMSRSDLPTSAYATVYPLTMLLRIFVAQVMTLWMCR